MCNLLLVRKTEHYCFSPENSSFSHSGFLHSASVAREEPNGDFWNAKYIWLLTIVLVNLHRKNTQVYDRCAKTKLLYKTFQKLYIKFHLEEAGKSLTKIPLIYIVRDEITCKLNNFQPPPLIMIEKVQKGWDI